MLGPGKRLGWEVRGEREEGRGKREEGRGKREEGRGKREGNITHSLGFCSLRSV